MKTKLLSLVLAVALCLSLVPLARAEQIPEPNFALNAKVLGDSGDAITNEESKNVFDGNTTETKWCKYESNYENSWVVFQLEAPANVGGMTVYHAGCGINETAKNNTNAFKLQILDVNRCTEEQLLALASNDRYQIMAMDSNWDDVCCVEENGADKTQNVVTMTGQRRIFRFQVMDPGRDQYIRIYEIELQKGIAINEENFPDAGFRSYVQELPGGSDNVFTPTEIAGITEMRDLSCADVTGIGYFTALKTLHFSYDARIRKLDLRQNVNLEYFECKYGSNLTSLNVSGCTKLNRIYCSKCALTELILGQNTHLTTLDCQENQLTELDLSQAPALTILYCSSNQLRQLNLTANTKLNILYCGQNQLTHLDLSHNQKLTVFDPGNMGSQKRIIPDGSSIAEEMPGFDINQINGEVNGGSLDNGSVSYAPGQAAITYWYETGLSNKRMPCTLLQPAGEELPDLILDSTNFPDANFLAYVQTLPGAEDGILTGIEVSQIKEIDCSSREIQDLTGIEHLVYLTSLKCGGNNLSQLDVTPHKGLTLLDCAGNGCTTLDLSQNSKLVTLNCAENKLGELHVSSLQELVTLNCSVNNLTELDISYDIKLVTLDCASNKLAKLNIGMCEELNALDCASNKLEKLDVSICNRLVTLDCSKNLLTELDVSQNPRLTELYCNYNSLAFLDLSHNSMLDKVETYGNKAYVPNGANITQLKPGFDLSKHDNPAPRDGVIADDGTVKYLNNSYIFYLYDCGNGHIKGFSLARFPLNSIQVVPQESRLICFAEGGSTLFSVSYDENGRMLSIPIAVHFDYDDLYGNDIGTHAGQSLFLVSKDGSPLCASLTIPKQ